MCHNVVRSWHAFHGSFADLWVLHSAFLHFFTRSLMLIVHSSILADITELKDAETVGLGTFLRLLKLFHDLRVCRSVST